VVEARVGQLQPKQVLPVDPRPHCLGGLPVGQALTELQDGHQRQAPGRQPRLAEPGKQVGKIGIGEDSAELVAKGEKGIALAEGSLGDAHRLFGYGLDHGGFERHGLPPVEWTCRRIPAYPGSADFANGIRRFSGGFR
jgi:hypothetical protein